MCVSRLILVLFFFFFNDTATTEIYTLSLHDALPILSYAPLILGPRKHVPAGTRHLIGTLCQCQAKLRPDLNFSPRRRYKRAIRDIAMTKHVRRKTPTSPARAKPRAAARHAAAAAAGATAGGQAARERRRRPG